MVTKSFCRVCLATDVNTSLFLNTELKNFIHSIFQQHGFYQDIDEQQFVCYECEALLIKSYRFIKRALRAQTVLNKMLRNSEVVTLAEIQNIDRHQLNLNSYLAFHQTKIDYHFYDDHNEDKNLSMCEVMINHETKKEEDYDNLQFSSVKQEYGVDSSYNTYLRDALCSKSRTSGDFQITTGNTSITKHTNKTLPDKKDAKEKENKCEGSNYANNKTIIADNFTNLAYNECKVDTDTKTFEINTSITIERCDDIKDISYDKVMVKQKEGEFMYIDPSITENEDDIEVDIKKVKKDKDDDEDYQPNTNVSEESETDFSFVDFDNSSEKIVKRPKTKRIYPRKCDHCNYEIDVKKNHYKHYIYCHEDIEFPYHLPEQYQCQYCGIKKRTVQRLRDHEMTHGEKQLQCQECPKKFFNITRLNAHKRLKHSGKYCICDYCNKKFSTKWDLVLHIRTHTGEKPFKCHICGAAYAHRGNVGVHIRNIHQNNRKIQGANVLSEKRKGKHIKDADSNSYSDCDWTEVQKKNKTRTKKKQTNKMKAKSNKMT